MSRLDITASNIEKLGKNRYVTSPLCNVAYTWYICLFPHSSSLAVRTIVTRPQCHEDPLDLRIAWVNVHLAWVKRYNLVGKGQRAKTSDHIVQYFIGYKAKVIKCAAVGFWSNLLSYTISIYVQYIGILIIDFYITIIYHRSVPKVLLIRTVFETWIKLYDFFCNIIRGNTLSSLGSLWRFSSLTVFTASSLTVLNIVIRILQIYILKKRQRIKKRTIKYSS